LTLFVDATGVVIGRNDVALMRGDPVAELYPSLKRSLEAGRPGGGLWVDIQRQEQLFVTYAPVFDLSGQRSLGAVVLGVPINDEALARTSELTSGETLVALAQRGEGSAVLARHGAPLEAAERAALVEAAGRAARANTVLVLDEAVPGHWVALRALPDGLVLTTLVGASANGMPVGWLWGIVLLGIGMVLVAAFLFGDYVSRPISELEDGLLQIVNGDTELRFDLEHDVLGGLVSRINSMLDALTGDLQSAPPAPLEEETAVDRPA
jgi:methyl-accepting chemotaxis protein